MLNLEILTDHGKIRNLSGKERGIAARSELALDALDIAPGTVQIIVPEYVDTITPSFFQGLFSASIAKLNGKEGFLQKYTFEGSAQVLRWVEVGIRNATASRRPLI